MKSLFSEIKPKPIEINNQHCMCFPPSLVLPQAARAWEAALLALLTDPQGRVARLAAEGNLTLSFSTERPVVTCPGDSLPLSSSDYSSDP